MKVQIDDLLTVDCVSIAGFWNGWARPLFTREQLDIVRDEVIRNGGELYDIDGGSLEDSATVDMTTLDYVIRWDDLYEINGWIWSTVDAPCIYCGYIVDSSVKCDCGAES